MHRPDKNREMVARAANELFVVKDLGAVDRYFAEPYVQHNPVLPNGLDAFREFARQAIVGNPAFKAELLCVLADGTFVASYHRYSGLGPVPLVAVDLFRVQDGKIVEHWDCIQGEAPGSDGLCTELAQLNGARLSGTTEHHLSVVKSFIEATWMAPTTESTRRWGPPPAGAERLQCSPGSKTKPLRYARIHRALAEGNLVLTQSEAETCDQVYACYDLFLVEGNTISRYWSIAQDVPSSCVGDLPMF